jgi:TonB-linked SusC/RagA family outer membrane protein
MKNGSIKGVVYITLNKNVLKILMIMKLTTFFFLVGILSVAAKGYSQHARLDLSLQNASIQELFLEIEKQSEFNFFYKDDQIDVNRLVSIEANNSLIGDVLNDVFADDDVTYTIVDKVIVITPKKVQQGIQVTGTVKSASSGESLPGVNIIVKGTTKGAISNAIGSYSISVDNSDAILVFSYVGHITQEVEVGDRTTIEVMLQEDVFGLEEVVVVGYGTQKKINLTGAVDVINDEEVFSNRPAENVGQVLQGVSPNLNISLSDDGGEPGAGNNWNIRGIGSLEGDDDPLILVDGVEMDVNTLDPSSIESVSVLKDAASSAIYGSRAPFGVILIQTKHGEKGSGFKVHYNNTFGFSSPLRLPHFVSSEELATAFNQACDNSNLLHTFSDEQMDRIRRHMEGTYLPQHDTVNTEGSIWDGRWNGNANIDWMDEYYRKNSPRQKHTLSLEGGSEKTQYFVSAGYFMNDGLYNVGYDSYDRYNFLSNITSQVTDWMRLDFKTKFSQEQSDYPVGEFGPETDETPSEARGETFLEMKSFWPTTPKYNWGVDPNDHVRAISNPIYRSLEGAGRSESTSNDSWITIGTVLEPVKGWETNIYLNYNYFMQRNSDNEIPVPVHLPSGEVGNIGARTNTYKIFYDNASYINFNARTSYERSIKDHYFKVMVGYEQESNFYAGLNASGRDVITSEVPSISTALGDLTVDDHMSHWSTQALFSRINYDYKGKYLFEANGRYNGSSRFAKDSRWGFFPSFSAGYNISRENFWTPVENIVNTLKFRGSYGSLGNQNVPNYLYLDIISIAPNLEYVIGNERPNYVTSAPNIVSSNLTWETVTTFNVGIDAGFLDNRLWMTFDWFNRTTTEMFGPSIDLPGVLGASVPQENNATLETKGWEGTLNWKDRVSSDFNYNIRVSLGDSKTTILEYLNEEGLIDNWYVGKEYGEIWGYTSDGFIQTEGEEMPDQSYFFPYWHPGDMKYKDLNGDNVINDGERTLNDHGDLSVIGNSSPRYNIGIAASFTWKNLDFNMFWQGILKHPYYPYYSGSYSSSSSNFWGIVGTIGHSGIFKGPALDYWRPADETNILGPNTDAYFPAPYSTAENAKSRQTQSKYLLNSAYIRLKNIQLGYTLPQELTKKVHIQRLRVYVSGENLLTVTSLPEALDPEGLYVGYYGLGQTYPLSKIFAFGLNLTF